MSEIPTPSESGVTGTQQLGSASTALVDATPPTHGLAMSQAIEGLAVTRPRGLGGDVPAALVAGAVSHLSHDLRSAKRAIIEKDQLAETLHTDLTSAKVAVARLEERLGALATVQRLKQFSIFAGTAILGVAATLYPTNAEKTSYVLGAIGAGLLILGWFTGKPGGEE
jgi:hypothetical protein